MKKYPLLAALLGLAACRYDSADELFPAAPADCATAVTYGQTIQPLLAQRCGSCHAGAAASGGVRLDSHADVKKVAASGKLVGVIRHAAGFSPMPLGGAKLSDCNIGQVQQWIKAGMPDN
jgi:mono/diheme cytochrome c family protein